MDTSDIFKVHFFLFFTCIQVYTKCPRNRRAEGSVGAVCQGGRHILLLTLLRIDVIINSRWFWLIYRKWPSFWPALECWVAPTALPLLTKWPLKVPSRRKTSRAWPNWYKHFSLNGNLYCEVIIPLKRYLKQQDLENLNVCTWGSTSHVCFLFAMPEYR